MISLRPGYIIKIMFAAAVILLLAYITIEKLYSSTETDKPVLSFAEADSVFTVILKDYRISSSWYSKRNGNYTIRLPNDVASELLILDLAEKFKGKDVILSSKETKKNQKSFLEVSSDGKLLVSAEFIYDKNNVRENSNISFILMNIGELNDEERTELANSTERYSLALYPSKENRWLADSLTLAGQSFVVLINSEIDELQYKLDDKFSDRKLVTTISTITEHFGNAVFFILDDLSNQYSPRVNSLITGQFKKRGIKYFPLKNFPSFSPEKYSADENRVFRVDASGFIKMGNEFKVMRKSGTRIVSLASVY